MSVLLSIQTEDGIQGLLSADSIEWPPEIIEQLGLTPMRLPTVLLRGVSIAEGKAKPPEPDVQHYLKGTDPEANAVNLPWLESVLADGRGPGGRMHFTVDEQDNMIARWHKAKKQGVSREDFIQQYPGLGFDTFRHYVTP
jgi:hypothetical protein